MPGAPTGDRDMIRERWQKIPPANLGPGKGKMTSLFPVLAPLLLLAGSLLA